MTSWQIIGLLLALLIMLAGLIGCLVPGLPGAPLVLAAGPARDETTHCYQFGRPPELTDAAAVGEAFFDLTTSGAEIIIDTAH